MAIIYDFTAYHSANLLSNFSQKANDVVHDLSAQNQTNQAVKKICEKISKTQLASIESLNRPLVQISQSWSFRKQCALAWELDNLDEMIAERDKLFIQRFSGGN